MSDLGKRSISGLIGLILLITVVLKGGYFLYLAVYIISMIGLKEFYAAVSKIKINPVSILGYIYTTGIFLNLLFEFDYLQAIFVFGTIILLLSIIKKQSVSIEDIAITILGVLYIPFLLSHIVYLDKSLYIWLVFIIAFGTDTFAYISGNLFGKNKLAPNISPNKTIEGAIGGVIGSSLLSIIFVKLFQLNSIIKMVPLFIICSVLAQMGDLVASRIKRITGIKDFGFIIPGHGGVLDRFDSIIVTAPVIYYYISSFVK